MTLQPYEWCFLAFAVIWITGCFGYAAWGIRKERRREALSSRCFYDQIKGDE